MLFDFSEHKDMHFLFCMQKYQANNDKINHFVYFFLVLDYY